MQQCNVVFKYIQRLMGLSIIFYNLKNFQIIITKNWMNENIVLVQ